VIKLEKVNHFELMACEVHIHSHQENEYDYKNARAIPITEEEYREFLKLLMERKCIDKDGKRIDGKAVRYAHFELDPD